MRAEANPCPIELSWATFQRKVPSGKNDGIVRDIPLLSLRLNLFVPQPAPDPIVVYICDVAILAVFKRAKGVTGDQKARVIVRTSNFPISEPSPLEMEVALSANAESVSRTIEVNHAKVPVPSTIGSHEFISEVEFVAGQTVLGKAAVQVQACKGAGTDSNGSYEMSRQTQTEISRNAHAVIRTKHFLGKGSLNGLCDDSSTNSSPVPWSYACLCSVCLGTLRRLQLDAS